MTLMRATKLAIAVDDGAKIRTARVRRRSASLEPMAAPIGTLATGMPIASGPPKLPLPRIVEYVLPMEKDPLDRTSAKDPGDAFEEVFWGLLRRRYLPQDLVRMPATMGGDFGIEGFSSDGIAYQCYADRDSLTLRHRTDKQKQKLYTDICKLETHAEKLIATLDGLMLDYYFLCVPEYHAAELVTYAAARAEAVRGYGLGFISENFAIRIKCPEDYPAELAAAVRDGAAKALVPEPHVLDEQIELFAEEKPDLVQVLESKLAIVKQTSPGADTTMLRDQFIRAFLAKEQVMDGLRDWPDTWDGVELRRQLRQQALELESELSPNAPNRRVLDLIRDYEADLVSNVRGLREADVQQLARGQTGEWLMRCPLRFRSSS